MKGKIVGFLLVSLFFYSSIFAETIELKSGQKISGKILEQNRDFVQIEIQGIPVTYYREQIKSIYRGSDEDNISARTYVNKDSDDKSENAPIKVRGPQKYLKSADLKGKEFRSGTTKTELIKSLGQPTRIYRERGLTPVVVKQDGSMIFSERPGKNQEIWVYQTDPDDKDFTFLFLTIDKNTDRVYEVNAHIRRSGY